MYVGDKLDVYNDSSIILEKKIHKKIISWVTILVILLVLLVVFSMVPFNIYKPVIGKVNITDNKTFLELDLNYSGFPVNRYNKLYIRNKEYNYKIVSIEDNILLLDINLDESLKIQNNIVNVNVLKNRTTIFKIIRNKIKKGFGV
ncbi:MAG: hypothetical protein IJE04_01345 [Bacilli bacterium]|nr:hypothetical protein [Bacilli bacterium]